MPNASPLRVLECRLLNSGCPLERVRDRVQELADHHEDLRLAALADGCSDLEAEALADAKLGDPMDLAQHLVVALREASWWGRHPFLGFCILPPIAYLISWLLVSGLIAVLGCGVLLFRYGRSFVPSDLLAAMAVEPDAFGEIYALVREVNYLSLALVVVAFCRMAYRRALAIHWSVAACVVCSAQGLFVQTSMQAHSFAFGYGWPPNWTCGGVSLGLGAIMVMAQSWRRFPWLQRVSRSSSPSRLRVFARPVLRTSYPRRLWQRRSWTNPTSMLTVTAVFGLLAVLLVAREREVQRAARLAQLRTRIWPQERAAVVEQLRRHQMPETILESTIDLQPCANARLSDSLPFGSGAGCNDLSSLPSGTHVFAGVPFAVSGRVQLLGRDLTFESERLPTRVRDIQVGRRCEKLHLLHGACFPAARNPAAGLVIGRLVLHYVDGGKESLPIALGQHVLNFWGPVFVTGSRPERRFTTAAGTELAWVGANSDIRHLQPENSLRLYRSTFANPRPSVRVASVEYVSKVTEAAPFLAGLTVE